MIEFLRYGDHTDDRLAFKNDENLELASIPFVGTEQITVGMALQRLSAELNYRDGGSSDGWDDEFLDIDTDTLIGWECELYEIAHKQWRKHLIEELMYKEVRE